MSDTLTRTEAMGVLDHVAGKLENDPRGEDRNQRDAAVLYALYEFFETSVNTTLGVEVRTDE